MFESPNHDYQQSPIFGEIPFDARSWSRLSTEESVAQFHLNGVDTCTSVGGGDLAALFDITTPTIFHSKLFQFRQIKKPILICLLRQLRGDEPCSVHYVGVMLFHGKVATLFLHLQSSEKVVGFSLSKAELG